MSRVSIAVIATGRYRGFVDALLESARKFLFPECEREFLLFLDEAPTGLGVDCHVYPAEHQPWPLVTLRRFATVLAAEDRIAVADWFLFLDADMRVASPIALSDIFDETRLLTGVRHPYVPPGPPFPLERDRRSAAFVAHGREAAHYWQGCLWGGRSPEALAMIRELAASVAADQARGITARWHDESHLNRYFGEHEARVKTLDPGFALPDIETSLSYRPRILHLDKDDSAFGNLGPEKPTLLRQAQRLLDRLKR